MANSTREKILDSLVSAIAAITTGGGYNNNVGEAMLGLKAFESVPTDKFPAVYVAGADENRIDATNIHFTSQMPVSIIGYAWVADASDTAQLEREVSRLIEDLTKAVMMDITRGGIARSTKITQIKTDKGAWVPYAGFEMTVEVAYRAAFTAP